MNDVCILPRTLSIWNHYNLSPPSCTCISEISSAPQLTDISSKPCLHPPQPYVCKKRITFVVRQSAFWLTPPFYFLGMPPPHLFLPLFPSMHIHLCDYFNGCQKNTVTCLNWAVWECTEEERGPAIFHTPFCWAGKWREGEREAVAMATCWQLLSLCLESAGCSLSTQCLGGCKGRKEVRGRKGVMGRESGWEWSEAGDEGEEEDWWDGGKGGAELPAPGLTTTEPKSCYLGKEQHSGLDPSQHTYIHTHTGVLMIGMTARVCWGVALGNCFSAATQFRCLFYHGRYLISKLQLVCSAS